jgi:hypothetical protein
MLKNMKKYTISVMHRGQQITKMVCAKNTKEAANLLGVNAYFINKYGFKNKIETPFDGVIAYFDSGMLWREEKSLIRVEMPLERLIAIIDSYQDKSYAQFKTQMGI